MVQEGMSDVEISEKFGVTRVTIYFARQALGIPAGRKAGGRQAMSPPAEPPPVCSPQETYEENGVTVKRYPARYAEGAGVQTVTARPRR